MFSIALYYYLTVLLTIQSLYNFILGAVFQATGNYDASFLLGGGLFLAGAACHLVLHLPCVRKRTRDEDTVITAPEPDTEVIEPREKQPLKTEHVTIDETNLKSD